MSESHGGWRKSSFSNQGACVEVKFGSEVYVRDSKDRDGPVLHFSSSEWTAFLHGVTNGEFDVRHLRSADSETGVTPP